MGLRYRMSFINNKQIKIFILIILCISIFFTGVVFSAPNFALAKNYGTNELAYGILNWKKNSLGLSETSQLFSGNILKNSFGTSLDWYAFAMGRMGMDDDYTAYAAACEREMASIIENDGISKNLVTDFYRMSLAYYAAGGEPSSIFTNDGEKDLLALTTYLYDNVGRQGINGYIWALLTLDAKGYVTPNDTLRKEYVKQILSRRLSDGGFALSGDISDPDMTGMALTALAPYYNTSEIFIINGESLTVSEVVDKAFETLSSIQENDGDYSSWNVPNSKSTAWVMIALLSYGKDIYNDEKFIKNGNNVLDGLLKYLNSDGGFCHTVNDNQENKSDSMSCEQVFYALAALDCFDNEKRALFDLRKDFTVEEKNEINQINNHIEDAIASPDKEKTENILNLLSEIPAYNRRYIKNYAFVLQEANKYQLNIPSDEEIFKGNYEKTSTLYEFAQENKILADDILSSVPATSQYTSTLKLLYILKRVSLDQELSMYMQNLNYRLLQIESIFDEISLLNSQIEKMIYPLDNLKLRDLKSVRNLLASVDALSDQDKQLISGYEDLKVAKIKLESQQRAVIISVCVAIVVLICLTVLMIDIKKRKKAKKEIINEDDEE